MAKLVKLSFDKLPDCKVIGRLAINSIDPEKENSVPAMWEKSFEDGTFETLESMQPINASYVGWMGEFDPETKNFTYIAGMLFAPDTAVPEGFDSRGIEACTVAISWIQGEEPDIYMSAHTLTAEEIQKSSYTTDYTQSFSMEVYDPERFGAAVEQGKKELILDYYQPCVPRTEAE